MKELENYLLERIEELEKESKYAIGNSLFHLNAQVAELAYLSIRLLKPDSQVRLRIKSLFDKLHNI
ncbi:hypothetical protein [Christiangramia sp. SM2212]|uniref:Uncharacterized protein n=1 Tax=Christiangramia sediminicola TaxID=3073267 RepID=A0ABU1EPE2_9FLAO|nr:hypothetical protein [Christiangramia sp. SM2212]MDR5590264.1 hypothetical protein [Christiangramia sp. SM2212]